MTVGAAARSLLGRYDRRAASVVGWEGHGIDLPGPLAGRLVMERSD